VANIPFEIVGSKEQQTSLLRLASSVADNGLDTPGPYRVGQDLFLRLPPRLRGQNSGSLTQLGERPLAAAKGWYWHSIIQSCRYKDLPDLEKRTPSADDSAQ